MHMRVLLSRYRAYTPCTACGGARLKPDALLWRVAIAADPTCQRRQVLRTAGRGAVDDASSQRYPACRCTS